ncbi:sorting nexin-8-like [Anopheles cruzii]|uniref:sorting nexin-8-like n=1 Tax=Anopheles cruzii TaxID=68878 RepID=UPI0022EC4AC6|nr:sorting nexin-8-like [Anopheles cruzii]
MPAVVETNFHHPVPASAPSSSSSPLTAAVLAREPPATVDAAAPIPLRDVLCPAMNGTATLNQSAGAGRGDIHHPHGGRLKLASNWSNGSGILDQSRSPSVGETFISAAASSEAAYVSSFSDSDCTDDSDAGGGPDEEEAEMLDFTVERSAYGYVTTATIAVPGQNGQPNGMPSGASDGAMISLPTELSPQAVAFVVPEQGPSPSSGSTSVALSFESSVDDSTVRELNERHISIKLVPEKKGLFLKHSEYEIKRKGSVKPVRRRYKDFVTLHCYLMEKYPYRALPALPPKQLMLDSLLEERRRGLQAWLTFVSLHPVLQASPLVSIFLQDVTTDYRYRMRVAYEKQIDEFARLRQDVSLPTVDGMGALAASKTRMHRVQDAIGQLMQLFDHQARRTKKQLTERATIDRILQSDELRGVFGERCFDDMRTSVGEATVLCEKYVQIQHRAVIERLRVLLDALYAHSDLCERIERGAFADYQKALAKAATGSGTVKGKTADTLTTTSMDRDVPDDEPATEVSKFARRSAFAFSCARSETDLIERYLQSLPSILLSYAFEEQQHHQKMAKIWHELVTSESGKLL